ncbi:MAG: zinc ABC transporter ATP-binding protein ZnuC [Desulfuromonas sp.]|nr:MAG: zinc ABC transporter ATP-binding protein ZnuC [Desulfuromonas sp.]
MEPCLSQSANILELEHVDLVRSQRFLLEQVSLQLQPGEILTIIGPNGAGKTTLIRVALGLLPATSGRVYRQAGITVGYMPQRLHIDPTFPLTVKRFLTMTGKPQQSRVLQSLEEVGAAHVLNSPLQTLSGGEMQRVLLAHALLREPHLLVLDEPVQGVDVHGQMELYKLIAGIRDQHRCAILMVSHDLHLVMAATDRVLCLNRHICCSGSPEAVTSDPAYLELFGPQAVGNLAIYTHDRDHRHNSCADCKEGNHDH